MRPKWFRSLAFNLITWYVLLFLTLVLLISWSVIKIVETEVLREQIRNFEMITTTMGHYVEQSLTNEKVRDIEVPARWFIDPLLKEKMLLGLVIMYSYIPIFKVGNISNPKSEITALITSPKKIISFIYAKKRKFTISKYSYVDTLWKNNNNVQLIARFNLKWFNIVTSRIFKLIFTYIFATTILIVVILLWVTERKIANPIRRLTEASEKVARGDFLSRKPYQGSDEFGFLSEAMLSMSNKIKDDRETIINQVKELNHAYKKLKEMQEEIVRNEKMALVGQMSSGLAHEIGNPITSIIGLSEILLQTGNLNEEDKDLIKRIHKEGKRIDTLIKTLLDFSRPKDEKKRRTNITSIINNSLEILQIQGKLKGIDTKLNLEDLDICIEEEKLLQVILNLLINAIDAIKEKFGRSSGGKIEIFSEKKGDTLIIQIQDNGTGIREENLSKIFLPFFTTKEPGKGTGLGLYVSSTLIEGMGGKILVESFPSVGTTFKILFPIDKISC